MKKVTLACACAALLFFGAGCQQVPQEKSIYAKPAYVPAKGTVPPAFQSPFGSHPPRVEPTWSIPHQRLPGGGGYLTPEQR